MLSLIARHIPKAHRIFYRVLPLLVVLIIAKLVVHRFGVEVLSINSLFSGLIGANVFLMGFLLSGVLSDYKESERLPGRWQPSWPPWRMSCRASTDGPGHR